MAIVLNAYYDYDTNEFLVQKTFRLLGIKDYSLNNLNKLSTKTLIYHGLPVKQKVLNELYDENAVTEFIKVKQKYDL